MPRSLGTWCGCTHCPPGEEGAWAQGVLSALSCACQRGDRDTEPALFIISKWFFPVFCSLEVLRLTSWILQFA